MRKQRIEQIKSMVKRPPLPKRICQYSPCRVLFTPIVAHQIYCQNSHRIEAFRLREFEHAVEREVEKRLKNTPSLRARES